MKIGIDFDNTIACYDGAFYKVAVDQGLIPVYLPTTKNSIRDYLNKNNLKDSFTELQGYIYGKRMDLAKPYDGIQDFASAALNSKHDLYIVSHKTRFPILGPRYDLHDSAIGFLKDHFLVSESGIAIGNVYFEETKDKKIDRINALNIDVFIDDLPEILEMKKFSDVCRRILFDPHENHSANRACERFCSWYAIKEALL